MDTYTKPRERVEACTLSLLTDSPPLRSDGPLCRMSLHVVHASTVTRDCETVVSLHSGQTFSLYGTLINVCMHNE